MCLHLQEKTIYVHRMKQGASSSCYRHLQFQKKMTIWAVKDTFSASKRSTDLFNHVWLHRDKLARSDWFGFDYFNHMVDVIYVAVIVLWLMPPVEMIASFSQALLLGVGRAGAGKGNGYRGSVCGSAPVASDSRFQSWLYGCEAHCMKWTFSWLYLKNVLLSTNLVILKTIILIIKAI